MTVQEFEQKIQTLREEYKAASNDRRLILLRMARGYQNAIDILKAPPLPPVPKADLPPFNHG